MLKPTFIVYGPPGCGKSTHAATIAKLLGVKEYADDFDPFAEAIEPDCVYLTTASSYEILDVLEQDRAQATILPFDSFRLHLGDKGSATR